MAEPNAPMVPPLCILQIPVKSLTRAKDFYTKALGFTFFPVLEGSVEKGKEHLIEPFHMENNGSSVGGILLQIDGPIHAGNPNGIVNFYYVDDIKATLEKVTENGGKVVKEPYPQGEICTQAQIEDSEGNFIGLWQPTQFYLENC